MQRQKGSVNDHFQSETFNSQVSVAQVQASINQFNHAHEAAWPKYKKISPKEQSNLSQSLVTNWQFVLNKQPSLKWLLTSSIYDEFTHTRSIKRWYEDWGIFWTCSKGSVNGVESDFNCWQFAWGCDKSYVTWINFENLQQFKNVNRRNEWGDSRLREGGLQTHPVEINHITYKYPQLSHYAFQLFMR